MGAVLLAVGLLVVVAAPAEAVEYCCGVITCVKDCGSGCLQYAETPCPGGDRGDGKISDSCGADCAQAGANYTHFQGICRLDCGTCNQSCDDGSDCISTLYCAPGAMECRGSSCGGAGASPSPGASAPPADWANCRDITVSAGSVTLTKGVPYTFSALYEDIGGGVPTLAGFKGTSLVGPWPGCVPDYTFWQEIAGGGNGVKSFNQTFNETGEYTIFCMAILPAVRSCEGFENTCSTTDYTCAGPNAYIQVDVVEPPATCTIESINPGQVYSGTGGTTQVTYSGTVSHAAATQDVRLFLERRDGEQVPGFPNSLTSSDMAVTETLYPQNNGKYYYQVGSCEASNGGSCSKTVTITAPAADYYVHCDVDPGSGRCSGNPFCSYEGGGENCPQWQSCSDSDNGQFNVDLPCPNNPTQTCSPDGQLSTFKWDIFDTNNASGYTVGLNSSLYQLSSSPYSISIAPGVNYNWYVQGIRPYEVSPYTGQECPNTDFFCNLVTASAWWQVDGGNVHADGGDVRSSIPSMAALPYLITGVSGLPSFPGVLNVGGGTINETASSEWWAQTVFRGLETKYGYFERILADDPAGFLDWEGGQPANNSVYFYDGSKDTSGVWNIGSAGKIVILVEGDVTITENINVDLGGFLAIIASGDIIIADDVTNVEGVYVADETISSGTGNSQLIGEGIFTGWQGINLERDFNSATNNTTPAEIFIYRPDLVRNAYRYLLKPKISWQEVAP